jgi:hypothetical protein
MKTYKCEGCKKYKCTLTTSLPIYPDCPGGLNSLRDWKESEENDEKAV